MEKYAAALGLQPRKSVEQDPTAGVSASLHAKLNLQLKQWHFPASKRNGSVIVSYWNGGFHANVHFTQTDGSNPKGRPTWFLIMWGVHFFLISPCENAGFFETNRCFMPKKCKITYPENGRMMPSKN